MQTMYRRHQSRRGNQFFSTPRGDPPLHNMNARSVARWPITDRNTAVFQSVRAINARVRRSAYTLAPAMRWHCSAHLRQASAQSWQCSASCFSHSAAQASQISAHSRHNSCAKREPRLMNAAAPKQASAQSRSSRMHSAILSTSGSPRHASAQCSHICAHLRQASIQAKNCLWDISCTPISRGIIRPRNYNCVAISVPDMSVMSRLPAATLGRRRSVGRQLAEQY